MPPKPRPGGPDPHVAIEVHWTPNQMAHYFMGVANYEALRVSSGEDTLPRTHPMVQLQMAILDLVPNLIGTGVANGWDVGGLITIQNHLNAAMQAEREGDGEQA